MKTIPELLRFGKEEVLSELLVRRTKFSRPSRKEQARKIDFAGGFSALRLRVSNAV